MAHIKELTKGIFRENPTFIIMLGMCPTLGVTTQVFNAFGMGASVLFVLLGSNIFISALRKIIPDSIRIPAYIVVIASFVTIVEMVLHAFVPAVFNALGVYLPLIVVNCIILGRAEAFANKNTVLAIREIFGSGTITLFNLSETQRLVITIPGLSESPVRVLTLAAGALLVMGYLKAFFTWRGERRTAKGGAR